MTSYQDVATTTATGSSSVAYRDRRVGTALIDPLAEGRETV